MSRNYCRLVDIVKQHTGYEQLRFLAGARGGVTGLPVLWRHMNRSIMKVKTNP